MSTAAPEQHSFQAEVQQLLNIVVHSLYTDKEIFIRELVSNASDALEKLRHLQLTNEEVYDDSLPLEINISTDDKAGTITIQDFGIGMTREELVENLGTIAHSGSKAFLKAVEEGAEVNANLIGQFGVGFYSVFMVAKEVKLYTHSWQADAEHLVWSSTGDGNYEIEPSDGQRRGVKVVVTLKDEEKHFALKDTVKSILERYSSFVQFPINLNGDRINKIDAIWLRSKGDITDEQYTEFYKFQANAFDEPLTRLHFNADAPLAINALLFVPQDNPERFGFGRMDPGVALYCRKVLIDAKPEGLLPEWMRFAKGVIDSSDLPLNISRETMQDSALVQKLNRVITRRFLKMLDETSRSDADLYAKIYENFQQFFKEGITTDFTYQADLAKLLRFESSLTEEGKTTSLADYVSRMGEEQKEIYWLYAPTREAIESGPYVEAFQARNLEVLYLFEPIDEFVMSNLGTFEEKRLVAASNADIQLDDVPDPEGEALDDTALSSLATWLKEHLGDKKVNKVEGSKRLVGSPVVALNADTHMTPSMRRMMKAMQKDLDTGPAVNLGINPRHTLVRNLATLKDTDPDLAKLVADQLYDNALIASGNLEDPRSMVERVNSLLERVSKA